MSTDRQLWFLYLYPNHVARNRYVATISRRCVSSRLDLSGSVSLSGGGSISLSRTGSKTS